MGNRCHQTCTGAIARQDQLLTAGRECINDGTTIIIGRGVRIFRAKPVIDRHNIAAGVRTELRAHIVMACQIANNKAAAMRINHSDRRFRCARIWAVAATWHTGNRQILSHDTSWPAGMKLTAHRIIALAPLCGRQRFLRWRKKCPSPFNECPCLGIDNISVIQSVPRSFLIASQAASGGIPCTTPACKMAGS